MLTKETAGRVTDEPKAPPWENIKDKNKHGQFRNHKTRHENGKEKHKAKIINMKMKIAMTTKIGISMTMRIPTASVKKNPKKGECRKNKQDRHTILRIRFCSLSDWTCGLAHPKAARHGLPR